MAMKKSLLLCKVLYFGQYEVSVKVMTASVLTKEIKIL